jgi:diacylglycerol kinase family enzyme
VKATLIFNKDAGQDNALTAEELQEALRDAGYEPAYEETTCSDDLDAVLENVEGLVVSAGGDGTAKAVATRLINNEKAALAILPMGTANNLTKTLEIEGTPLEIIERLANPKKHRIDLGHITAPWGEDYFIEGAGFGFFAEVLATYEPEKGKSVIRSLESIAEVIREGYGQRTTIRLPEHEITAEFLLAEFLNARAVGPRLKLAPNADPTDGLLQVVYIDSEQEEGYFEYLRNFVDGEMNELADVEVYSVSELEVAWNGFPLHVDGYVRPGDFDFRQQENGMMLRPYPDVAEEAVIQIEVIPQALSIWLPQREDGRAYDHEN